MAQHTAKATGSVHEFLDVVGTTQRRADCTAVATPMQLLRN